MQRHPARQLQHAGPAVGGARRACPRRAWPRWTAARMPRRCCARCATFGLRCPAGGGTARRCWRRRLRLRPRPPALRRTRPARCRSRAAPPGCLVARAPGGSALPLGGYFSNKVSRRRGGFTASCPSLTKLACGRPNAAREAGAARAQGLRARPGPVGRAAGARTGRGRLPGGPHRGGGRAGRAGRAGGAARAHRRRRRERRAAGDGRGGRGRGGAGGGGARRA